jgi:hypothetical protein
MSDNWSGEGMKRPCRDDIWSIFALRVGESRLQKRHSVGGTFSEVSYSASGISSEMESDSTSASSEEIRFSPCSSLSFCRWMISWPLACVSYCSSDNAGSLATRRLRLYTLPALAPHYNASRSFLLPRLSHVRTLELAGFESNRASIARKYTRLRSHSEVASFSVERCRRCGSLNVDSLMCKM